VPHGIPPSHLSPHRTSHCIAHDNHLPISDSTGITAYLQCDTMAAKGEKPEDAVHAALMLVAARLTKFDYEWTRLLMGHHAVTEFACESMKSGAEGMTLC